VQGHNSGGSGLYCNFSGTELNTYAEAFGTVYEKILIGCDMSYVFFHSVYFLCFFNSIYTVFCLNWRVKGPEFIL
jgi:hypothetical protein